MNKILLIGNLGRDPEANYTPSGTAVTRFTLAVTTRKTKGETDTDWFTIVAWDKLAEICNTYLTKGQKVFIEGRLQMRKYTDKTGVERTAIEVIASGMEMLSPKKMEEDDLDAILDQLGTE